MARADPLEVYSTCWHAGAHAQLGMCLPEPRGVAIAAAHPPKDWRGQVRCGQGGGTGEAFMGAGGGGRCCAGSASDLLL